MSRLFGNLVLRGSLSSSLNRGSGLWLPRESQLRTFMSPGFSVKDEWNKRLSSPIYAKIDMGQFFFEIERKFQREKRGSPIDVDLFATLATENHLNQLSELLHQFRRTRQTFLTSPSTIFAAVRVFVENGDTDNLMKMLDDRLNYGLFIDEYTHVYLLNHFLLAENWRDAAKVAVHMMLQEEIEIPIAKEMAFLGAYKYALLGTPEPWEPLAVPPEPEPEDDVKVRVEYLDSGYQDDHFDLTEGNHLVGKALVKISQKFDPSPVSRSLELLGWTMFEKWDKVELSVDKKVSDEFDTECVEKVKELIAQKAPEGKKEPLGALVSNLECASLDIEQKLREMIEEQVKVHEKAMMERQVQLFKEWSEWRERELHRQYAMYEQERRKEQLERKRAELREKEERLFFFERKEEMDEQKEAKLVEWIKKLPKRPYKRITLKPKEVVKDDYIPPDVKRSTANRK